MKVSDEDVAEILKQVENKSRTKGNKYKVGERHESYETGDLDIIFSPTAEVNDKSEEDTNDSD